MLVNPYFFFNGRCEEAVNFYATALGTKVDMLMRFRESPEPPQMQLPPGSEDKVMHASLHIGDTVVMASDGMMAADASFKGFALSISVPDKATADRYYTALSAGGKAEMPLAKTFWSPYFGMLTDKFGVDWMIGLDG